MPKPPGYEGPFKWHQVNIVGLVIFLAILLPLPITYIQWKKRNHPIMRHRLPALLFVVHWLCLPICGLLDAAFYIGFPFLPCEILFWNTFAIYQFYAYPYVIRSWKLLWLFRTTRLRVAQHESQFAEKDVPTTAMGAWLSKHRWLAEDNFLMKVWGFGFIIHFLPALILEIIYRDTLRDYSGKVGIWCTEIPAQFYFTVIYGFGYIIVVIVLSFFLAKADDAYFIKAEYRACSLIWLFCLIVWVIWVETYFLSARFPTYFWIAMGIICCFFVNGFWLTYKLRSENDVVEPITDGNFSITLSREEYAPPTVRGSSAYPGKLQDLLAQANFRQEFYEFLVLEFCVENLMFWEDVKLWKEFGCSLQVAKKIYRRFVVAGAPDQVNLKFENAHECGRILDACSSENPPPRTLFDDCVAEVVGVMDNDSLYRFRVFMRDKNASARLAATNIPRRQPLRHTLSMDNIEMERMKKMESKHDKMAKFAEKDQLSNSSTNLLITIEAKEESKSPKEEGSAPKEDRDDIT